MKINWSLFAMTFLVFYVLTLALNWAFSKFISTGSGSDFLGSVYELSSHFLLYPPTGTGMRLALIAVTPMAWRLSKGIDFFKGSKVREEKQKVGMVGYIFALGLLALFPIILVVIGPQHLDLLDDTDRRGSIAVLLMSGIWSSCLFFLAAYIFALCFIREIVSLFRKLMS